MREQKRNAARVNMGKPIGKTSFMLGGMTEQHVDSVLKHFQEFETELREFYQPKQAQP